MLGKALGTYKNGAKTISFADHIQVPDFSILGKTGNGAIHRFRPFDAVNTLSMRQLQAATRLTHGEHMKQRIQLNYGRRHEQSGIAGVTEHFSRRSPLHAIFAGYKKDSMCMRA